MTAVCRDCILTKPDPLTPDIGVLMVPDENCETH